MSNFERIPVEIFHLILGELPLVDVFKCKCVCKKWLAQVNSHYLASLVVSGSGMTQSECSFDTFTKVNPLNVAQKADLFTNQLTDQMFANLRQLYVYEARIESSFVQKLNCLQNLEELEVSKLRLSSCTLSLPKLRRLHLNAQRSKKGTIDLDCPVLTELKINKIEFARLRYPDRLITVHVLNYDPQLKELTSLKQLYISALKRNDLEDDFLAKLDQLESLFFEGEGLLFRLLNRQMEIYGRRIQIYHFGIRTNNSRNLVINYDHRLTESRTQFYTNRILADTLPVISCVEFNELLFDKLTKSFIARLSGVKIVIVFEPAKEHKLASFLETCGNVLRLHLFNSKFSADFYSSLARLTPFLAELNFNHFGDPLDYRFVTKLRFLRELTTINQLTISQLKMILSNLKLLKKLEFRYELQSVTNEVSSTDKVSSTDEILSLRIVIKPKRCSFKLKMLDQKPVALFKFTSQESLLSFIERLAERNLGLNYSSIINGKSFEHF